MACQRASAALGPRLISAYAIGSLAHSGFAPAVSDIDIAVLVDHCEESISPLIGPSSHRHRSSWGQDSPIAYRSSTGDRKSFGAPPPAARLGAIDRLDLIDHGVLIQGVDRRADSGVRPTRDELVAETADFLSCWEPKEAILTS